MSPIGVDRAHRPAVLARSSRAPAWSWPRTRAAGCGRSPRSRRCAGSARRRSGRRRPRTLRRLRDARGSSPGSSRRCGGPEMRVTSSSSGASSTMHAVHRLAVAASACCASASAWGTVRGKPSSRKPRAVSGCCRRSPSSSSTSSSGTSWPLSMKPLRALAERRVRLDRAAQHVAGRDVRDAEDLRQPTRPASPSRRREVRTAGGSHSTPGFFTSGA